MKLIKFILKDNNEAYYYIKDIIIAGKSYRTDYDSDLPSIIEISKTKNAKNLNTTNIQHIKEIIFEVEFNEIGDLLELIPEEFL